MNWQESAGSLLLLAAAEEIGLINTFLEVAEPYGTQQQMLTLLFMNALELKRPWDLRGYSGDGLALLTGRKRAFGYEYIERYLTRLAQSGTDEPLTEALVKWTFRLWQVDEQDTFYVDGHKKAVYSDQLIPRGLVGRRGAILGCRGLTLLHDSAGHPLCVRTGRGDEHLTKSLPEIVGAAGLLDSKIVVDRECMSAAFLKEMAERYTVVTLLRSEQYTGLESFQNVGAFIPMEVDKFGAIVREVAPAEIHVKMPDEKDLLCLDVALIRDWQREVPVKEAQPARREVYYSPKNPWTVMDAASPTEPKLIPIVCTASFCSALELANTYTQRWSAQENIIKDFLLPLGLDINHGYVKAKVENSEFTKRRDYLEQRLANIQRWAEKAYQSCERAGRRYSKLQKETRTFANEQYRRLKEKYYPSSERIPLWGDPPYPVYYLERQQRDLAYREERRAVDAQVEENRQRANTLYDKNDAEWEKYQRYRRQHSKLLRELEDLKERERQMYELDNRKDQIMTVLKVALVNLVMWVREHCFPQSYAHATWKTLESFFRLPGRVLQLKDRVEVILRRFNDRAMNRDLQQMCERFNDLALLLPDARLLQFQIERRQ